MHILHISHLYPNDFDPRYGIAIKNLVSAIPSKVNGGEIHQTIIVPIPLAFFPLTLFDPEWACFARMRKKLANDAQNVFYVPSVVFPRHLFSNYVNNFRAEKILSFLKSQNINPDLVHCHTSFGDGTVGKVLHEKLGIPYIVTVRREIDFENSNLSKNEKTTINETVRKASAVVAPSEHLKRKCLKNTGVEPLLVPNGIESDIIVNHFERNTGEIKTPIIVSTVGRLDSNKRIDMVIDLTGELVKEGFEIILNIIGEGSKKEFLIRKTIDQGLQDLVVFHGNQPHHEVIRILRNSDIFFLPSKTETFGLVFLEALAQGVPVLGTANQGIHGLGINGVHGFFCKTPEEFQQAFKKLLSQPELRAKFGEEGIKLVKNYTWEKAGETIANIYKRIIFSSQIK